MASTVGIDSHCTLSRSDRAPKSIRTMTQEPLCLHRWRCKVTCIGVFSVPTEVHAHVANKFHKELQAKLHRCAGIVVKLQTKAVLWTQGACHSLTCTYQCPSQDRVSRVCSLVGVGCDQVEEKFPGSVGWQNLGQFFFARCSLLFGSVSAERKRLWSSGIMVRCSWTGAPAGVDLWLHYATYGLVRALCRQPLVSCYVVRTELTTFSLNSEQRYLYRVGARDSVVISFKAFVWLPLWCLLWRKTNPGVPIEQENDRPWLVFWFGEEDDDCTRHFHGRKVVSGGHQRSAPMTGCACLKLCCLLTVNKCALTFFFFWSMILYRCNFCDPGRAPVGMSLPGTRVPGSLKFLAKTLLISTKMVHCKRTHGGQEKWRW